eukprot:948819-Amorphochlora_amoeboformis.AAC.1
MPKIHNSSHPSSNLGGQLPIANLYLDFSGKVPKAFPQKNPQKNAQKTLRKLSETPRDLVNYTRGLDLEEGVANVEYTWEEKETRVPPGTSHRRGTRVRRTRVRRIVFSSMVENVTVG